MSKARGDLHLVMRHPAGWIATGAGIGLIPWAPGTFGSALAIVLCWPLLVWPLWLQSLALAVGLVIGALAAGRAEQLSGVHDPGWIVCDELIGQWLTLVLLILLVPVPASTDALLLWLGSAFVAFRAFDILKPWPIRWIDRQVGGGWGTMWDDALAAVFAAPSAALTLWALSQVPGPWA